MIERRTINQRVFFKIRDCLGVEHFQAGRQAGSYSLRVFQISRLSCQAKHALSQFPVGDRLESLDILTMEKCLDRWGVLDVF